MPGATIRLLRRLARALLVVAFAAAAGDGGDRPGLGIRQPWLVVAINLLIAIAGLAALQGAEVREPPNIDPPVMSVRAEHPDAAPETLDADDPDLAIRVAIGEVLSRMGLSMLIVAIVVGLFIGPWRATPITVVAIPVSLVGMLAALRAMGFSLDLITLLALLPATGPGGRRRHRRAGEQPAPPAPGGWRRAPPRCPARARSSSPCWRPLRR